MVIKPGDKVRSQCGGMYSTSDSHVRKMTMCQSVDFADHEACTIADLQALGWEVELSDVVDPDLLNADGIHQCLCGVKVEAVITRAGFFPKDNIFGVAVVNKDGTWLKKEACVKH